MATGFIDKTTVDENRPSGRQYVVWDSGDGSTKGFGLLVLPSGVKSYVYQYRIGGRAGRTRRYTIGKHGIPWTPSAARKRANELAGQVHRGVDPIDAERAEIEARELAKAEEFEAARQAQSLALGTYVEHFLQEAKKRNGEAMRLRTKESYRNALVQHVVPHLRDKPISQIQYAEIRDAIEAIPASQPSVRRIVFAALNRLFNWAVSRRDIKLSPLAGMESPGAIASRDRVLSDEELDLALRAAEQMDWPFGPLYRLLFATGQRREEVAGLPWSELDREGAVWNLPKERSKNGEANIVPLNRHAVAVLDKLADVEGKDFPRWPRQGLIC